MILSPNLRNRCVEAQMTPAGFAIFCLIGFLLPVPILAWLDRPRAAP